MTDFHEQNLLVLKRVSVEMFMRHTRASNFFVMLSSSKDEAYCALGLEIFGTPPCFKRNLKKHLKDNQNLLIGYLKSKDLLKLVNILSARNQVSSFTIPRYNERVCLCVCDQIYVCALEC